MANKILLSGDGKVLISPDNKVVASILACPLEVSVSGSASGTFPIVACAATISGSASVAYTLINDPECFSDTGCPQLRLSDGVCGQSEDTKAVAVSTTCPIGCGDPGPLTSSFIIRVGVERIDPGWLLHIEFFFGVTCMVGVGFIGSTAIDIDIGGDPAGSYSGTLTDPTPGASLSYDYSVVITSFTP